jgi:hypothetical protein
LGAESRIAQARAAVFTRLTVAKAITTAVTKSAGTWTPVATGARPALARTAITAAIAPGWCFGSCRVAGLFVCWNLCGCVCSG